ncbi:MAG: response regulator, partial [Thiogranum sp.]|nr:response regulator [Thiogranum sp.]
ERMFEPFFSTKAPGQGSGMGLAMVHGIVHEYGGHILIDSRPGGGASLRVLLPVVTELPAAGTDAQGAVHSTDRLLEGRVLLVDDEPAVSEFMQDLLENWGLSVSVFNNSVEACQHFGEDPDAFELAVLDQTMPRMTGMDVSQHLLKLRPGLPVIIYTGYAEDLAEASVKQAGIRALVKKPVDTARLHDLVEELLDSATHRD